MITDKKGSAAVKILLIVFFSIAVILPLIRMLFSLAKTDIIGMITSERFLVALGNSFFVSTVSTVISILLATALSWAIVRTGIRMKCVWRSLFTLPMLIPSLSHGTGLYVLLGANGLLTRMLHLNSNIYGFWGIVIGSVMYSFPVAFLMISDVLKYEDSLPYEAADVLGISKFKQFTSITLPYLQKPMISAVFAIFTLIITDYGVPLMIGGHYITLPVMMYQDVIGLLDFGKGSVIGLVLLLPAFAAFMVDQLNKDSGNTGFITKPFKICRNRLRDSVAYLFCAIVSLFVLLPIAAFAILAFVTKYPLDFSFTFKNIIRAFQMQAGGFLLNSVVIAFCVSVFGVVISYAAAYCTARMKSKLSKLIHLMSITSLAIPGLVLGISYVLFFKGSFIYGTIAILVLVNMTHFIASPYLMAYNTLGKLNHNLEATGATLGVRRLRIIFDVLVPQSKATIAEMFVYFFVNSMMTISAVSFLANIRTQPISLMITIFESQMMLECTAFVSLVILAVNLLFKGIVYLYKRRLIKKDLI